MPSGNDDPFSAATATATTTAANTKAPRFATEDGEVLLTRLPRFFDGTHLARVGWYRRLLDRPLANGRPIGRGQFIDTHLGVQMLSSAMANRNPVPVADAAGNASVVSQGVLDICAEFGCWMWSGDDEPIIQHLNARGLLGHAELNQLRTLTPTGTPDIRQPAPSTAHVAEVA